VLFPSDKKIETSEITVSKTSHSRRPVPPAARTQSAAQEPPTDASAAPDPANAFGATVGQMVTAMSALSLPFKALAEVQSDYLEQATALWNQSLERLQHPSDASAPAAVLKDRRFAAQEWATNPAAAYTAQMYLLNAKTLTHLADQIEGDEKTKQRVRFAVQQWVDAVAPSNYLALNPEATDCSFCCRTCKKGTCRRLTNLFLRWAKTSPPQKVRWCTRTSCSN
jgi:Poly-beta-hydroxybutyrate polymerase (PhaC) N-terminus